MNSTDVCFLLCSCPPLHRRSKGVGNKACYFLQKSRVGSAVRTGHTTVFDRISVDVIEMGLEISFLFNRVLPEPSLPHSPTTILPAGIRRGLLLSAGFRPRQKVMGSSEALCHSVLIDLGITDDSSTPVPATYL